MPVVVALALMVVEAVKSAPAKVGVDAVVRFCPVLNASSVSPMESATTDAVNTPVALVYVRSTVELSLTESEVLEILLLKVFQSVDER
jgi:hypothetical protein